MPRRNMGNSKGHAAFVHSLTHIEFEAINLALDLIYRFRDMPEEFYSDWIGLCLEECEHFELMKNHLQTLGHKYGDFPVHFELWELARMTRHSLLERLALVPRMAEARGLDVAPAMHRRLKNTGHAITAEILQIIYDEEVGHVGIGSKWFLFLCGGSEEIAYEKYTSILARYGFTEIRKPLNLVARSKAGFSDKELNYLKNSAAQKLKPSLQ